MNVGENSWKQSKKARSMPALVDKTLSPCFEGHSQAVSIEVVLSWDAEWEPLELENFPGTKFCPGDKDWNRSMAILSRSRN